MEELLYGLYNLSIYQVIMFIIGGALIYLAIKKEYEPMLLLPIGFGAILANIPFSSAVGKEGFLSLLFHAGILTELFPILIFIAVGAMIDFKPLLQQPFMLFFGAAAQFGIFFTMAWRLCLGSTLKRRHPSASSAPPMVLHPSMWPPGSHGIYSHPFRWRRILTCLLSLSFSLRS